jgi:hypothetical protein
MDGHVAKPIELAILHKVLRQALSRNDETATFPSEGDPSRHVA